ncbi:MAG: ATP-dependent DNA helicase PcrA, partial [Candidatus Hydrogenedentota bacterium]
MSDWENIILENLNPEQQKAVQTIQGPVLILAGAGSGKTRTIVHRLAYMIHVKKIAPWKIVSVTFTNKAAQEMQQRSLEIAGPIASESIIRTYHSLGLYFLRQLAQYIDYPSNFTIWDDTDSKGALKAILSEFPGKYNQNHLRYFLGKISDFKDKLLSPEEVAEKVDLEEYEFGDILEEVYK